MKFNTLAAAGLVLLCAFGMSNGAAVAQEASVAGVSSTPLADPAASATLQPDDSVGAPDSGIDDADYVLGPQDVIELQVLGRADFNVRARIAHDGTIQLPYLGTIPAGGRTARDLGGEVAKKLEAGGYYANPTVRVDIVSYASRYVTVLGQVSRPGLVPIDRPYHLSEIVARVGGIGGDAADYLVIRGDKGAEHRYSIRGFATGDANQDPVVSPGDKIFIPKAEIFYISGQVKAPGAYGLESGMTLRMAIARGGGLTDLGTDHGVKVTGADGKVRRLKLSDAIAAGDVVFVGERLF
jgi:polysaccharide export outer membrane protein